MVRSGALTLGAILMLGAGGVQAQDISALGDAVPSLAGVLPMLPRNWADLPVTLKASEGVGYDSNIINSSGLSQSGVLNRVSPVGAFESVSDFQMSTKANVGGDVFFADGSLGFNRYLDKAFLDTMHHAEDAGVNWIYTSRCRGQLIASQQTSPSEPGQQAAVNVQNTASTTAFNETADCGVTGNYSASFNSGRTTSTNTAPADALNNSQEVFVSAGITYTAADTNSLQFLASVTGTNFNNRGLVSNGLGLAREDTVDKLNLAYTKNFDPSLSMVASIGVAGSRESAFSLSLPSGWEPQYSLSLNWTVTPKINLNASVARVVTPPTAIVANLQQNESINAGVAYQLTSKVTLSASVNASRATNAGSQPNSVLLVQNSILALQNSTSYGARANIAYQMTPFVGLSLSYSYTKTTSNGFSIEAPTSIALLTVNYSPF